MAGKWWPGSLDAWEQRQDGAWWGFCTVHVREWVDSPLVGLVYAPVSYVRWLPAGVLRERDGAVIEVEAWAREPRENLSSDSA